MPRYRRVISRRGWAGLVFTGLAVLVATLAASAPRYGRALAWRMEVARAAVLDRWSGRAETLPTPSSWPTVAPTVLAAPTVAAVYEDRAEPTPSASTSMPPATEPPPTAIPLPVAASLTGFRFEYQDINNCGPATMAMMLSYWGWEGDQRDIAAVVKPVARDKNVRWDEMTFYVQNYAGWLDALFRVGGTPALSKRFIASGYPVIIANGYTVKQGWVGHYMLLTGYDDESGAFTVQDATGGPDRSLPYADLDRDWQQFNRLFILVFPPADRDAILALLGPDADESANRQRALETAQAETERDPQDAFAWFNLGSNLNYFDLYAEAAAAFDQARTLGLPWRMLFYQFGPYRAYFNLGRYEDVIDLADAALNARPDLEESFFWRGWARYRLGDQPGAIADFNSALAVNPNFTDARAALESLGVAAD